MEEAELVVTQKHMGRLALVEKDAPVIAPEYLSVRQVAEMLNVSLGSVYTYLRRGNLSCIRIAHKKMVLREDVERFTRPRVGRAHTTLSHWQLPGAPESQMLTTIIVRLSPDQYVSLSKTLLRIRQEQRHGLLAGSILCNRYAPGEFKVLLFWDSAISSALDENTALSTLATDVADGLDWQIVSVGQWRVMLYAQ